MGIQLRQRGNFAAAFTVVVTLGLSSGAHADITISTHSTQNMSCSGGVCQPTATTAVLNVSDLEGYLASGNVEVTTAGSGGVQANNIDIEAALSWSSASTLSLVASQVIEIDRPVSVTGSGGLTLTNNGQNESLAFGEKGNVTFSNLSSSLTINGTSYNFESSVKELASAIASNPNGNYALPANYDAKSDGSYSTTPISTTFAGTFEGLGSAISNLSINDNSRATTPVGLFEELSKTGTVRDIALANTSVVAHKTLRNQQRLVGALVGDSFGTVVGASVSGEVKTRMQRANDLLGGLVGYNEKTGTVTHSYATASVLNGSACAGLVALNDGTLEYSYATGVVTGYLDAGGLVDSNEGQIIQSFATGAVSGSSRAGGFVDVNAGSIADSYATGSVAIGASAIAAGGLVSYNDGTITQSYSTGAVSSKNDGAYLGGLIGEDVSQSGNISASYWDLDTSGISNPAQGAGNIENDPGITGLTTKQFQSGLPDGFDPTIWAENSSINNGFPYLINNPPPQ